MGLRGILRERERQRGMPLSISLQRRRFVVRRHPPRMCALTVPARVTISIAAQESLSYEWCRLSSSCSLSLFSHSQLASLARRCDTDACMAKCKTRRKQYRCVSDAGRDCASCSTFRQPSAVSPEHQHITHTQSLPFIRQSHERERTRGRETHGQRAHSWWVALVLSCAASTVLQRTRETRLCVAPEIACG